MQNENMRGELRNWLKLQLKFAKCQLSLVHTNSIYDELLLFTAPVNNLI